MKRLAGCIDRGMEGAREALTQVGHYVQDLRAVDGLLRPSDEAKGEEREAQFVSLREAWQASIDPMHQQFANVMSSFEPGLFVGRGGRFSSRQCGFGAVVQTSQRPRASDSWSSPFGCSAGAARSNTDVGT